MGLALQAAGKHGFCILPKVMYLKSADLEVKKRFYTYLDDIARQFSSASATWDDEAINHSDKKEVEKFLLEQVPFTFEVKGL